jgi:uncharacterized SAM-binding protein YcdF (DUF218 family)
MTLPLEFLLKKALSAILLPPVLPLLLIFAGLLLLKSRPRLGRGLAWGGLVLTLLLSTPATIEFIVAPLESVPVLTEENLEQAGAIVILGAGQRRFMPEYDGATPNRLALERLRYGARLARKSGLPLLVSGGAPTGDRAEADLMAECLQEDFGVEPRWVEGMSLDTADNARFSARMLMDSGVRHIVLVTHAAHMRRAMNEFEAQGVTIIPAPTSFLSDRSGKAEIGDFLPSAAAAGDGWFATHEWLGLLAQKLRIGLFSGNS